MGALLGDKPRFLGRPRGIQVAGKQPLPGPGEVVSETFGASFQASGSPREPKAPRSIRLDIEQVTGRREFLIDDRFALEVPDLVEHQDLAPQVPLADQRDDEVRPSAVARGDGWLYVLEGLDRDHFRAPPPNGPRDLLRACSGDGLIESEAPRTVGVVRGRAQSERITPGFR